MVIHFTRTENEKTEISYISFNQSIKPTESKQISQIVFNVTNENPNGVNLGLDATFVPKIKKENNFTIDINKMSFKQFYQIDENTYIDPAVKLKQDALDKVAKFTKNINKKDSESFSGSEDSYYESDEESEEESEEKISILSKSIS